MARRGGPINKSSSSFRSHSRNMKASIREVEKRLARALSGIENSSETAIETLANSILKRSNELAPYDTGELRESSFVRKTRGGTSRASLLARLGDGPYITIGYMADHAVYTHEIGPYRQPTTPGTQYKYLETAMNERAGQARAIVRRQIVRELTGR